MGEREISNNWICILGRLILQYVGHMGKSSWGQGKKIEMVCNDLRSPDEVLKESKLKQWWIREKSYRHGAHTADTWGWQRWEVTSHLSFPQTSAWPPSQPTCDPETRRVALQRHQMFGIKECTARSTCWQEPRGRKKSSGRGERIDFVT